MTDKSKNELLSKLCSQLEQKYVTEPSKPPDLNVISIQTFHQLYQNSKKNYFQGN